MRLSKYTSLFQYGTEMIVFNMVKELLLILDASLTNLFMKNIKGLELLKNQHPSFFEQLENSQFIVPDNCDEAASLLNSWKAEDEDGSHFGMIINPTLNCNLRCWYCYEEHKPSAKMTDETKNSIIELIREKVSHPELKVLNVSFFGGEPLLSFKNVVMPILGFASKECQERNIKLYSNFTTNGVLLNEETLQTLNSMVFEKLPTFQITIDGNEEWHNRTRVGVNAHHTYSIILNNILLALQKGNEVHIRFNYTYDNILTFYDVLDDFVELGLNNYAQKAFVKFEHVWQDKENLSQARSLLSKVRGAFIEAGFNTDVDEVHYRHVCYADSSNHVVVNYDGNIYKCTARDFTPEKREGVLTENGKILFNERYRVRMQLRYGNPSCAKCKILPLCNGGCSQTKVEAVSHNTCYKHLDEKQKDAYVKARVNEILRQTYGKEAILP